MFAYTDDISIKQGMQRIVGRNTSLLDRVASTKRTIYGEYVRRLSTKLSFLTSPLRGLALRGYLKLAPNSVIPAYGVRE